MASNSECHFGESGRMINSVSSSIGFSLTRKAAGIESASLQRPLEISDERHDVGKGSRVQDRNRHHLEEKWEFVVR